MSEIHIQLDVSQIAAAIIGATNGADCVPVTRILVHRESKGSVLLAVERVPPEEMTIEKLRAIAARDPNSEKKVPPHPIKPTGRVVRGGW